MIEFWNSQELLTIFVVKILYKIYEISQTMIYYSYIAIYHQIEISYRLNYILNLFIIIFYNDECDILI